MTTRSRRSGGQAAKATPDKPTEQAKTEQATDEQAAQEQAADEQAKTTAQAKADEPANSPSASNTDKDGEQAPETVAPETERTDGGNAAGDGHGPVQRAAEATADTLQVPGDPVPAEVDKSMVRAETGLSPEVPEGDTPTAPTGDDERNGKPLGIGTDTTGELRHVEGAVATAAYGQDARNGHATGMAAEGQINTEFGGNGDSVAKLAGSGVRAETGVGTLDRDLPPDERPQYPSTTLTRATPDAAPMEPDDVKYATQPKLGDVQGSLDPTMAAAQMPSMAGDVTVKLVDGKGKEVKPSEFFEVPDGLAARNLRRVKHRVSEVFTVRKVSTPSQRLLFTEGQEVPVDVAETLIRLHG